MDKYSAFKDQYQIQRWCLKYFIVPADLDASEHISKLPYPDNFLSFWSFGKAEKVKKELEQSYKYGYQFRACEQYFKE